MSPLNILMVASEMKGLAKVGGLADVVRDLSAALVRNGDRVRVAMPGYAVVAPGTGPVRTLSVPFGGQRVDAAIETRNVEGITVDLVRCDRFFGGEQGSVYVDSAALGHGPFQDDAARFAFFSAAVAQDLLDGSGGHPVDVLHLHDWHTGTLLALGRCANRFASIGRLPTLFTIHNLDYQGQRPFSASGDVPLDSLEAWFPDLYDELRSSPTGTALADPHVPHCYNPMATAIALAVFVITVSPNDAREITLPDDPSRNFIGGRGLNDLLAHRASRGALVGLLNGIDYEEFDTRRLAPPFGPEEGFDEARAAHKEQLRALLASGLDDGSLSPARGALRHLHDPEAFARMPLFVAVTRMALQKMSLFLEGAPEFPLLRAMMELPVNVLVLGTGELGAPFDVALDLLAPANLLFVRQFAPRLANQLYAGGDFFLMPSDFEPCGISQLIAMRHGTLPIATAVGGLADTIQDGRTGFLVHGLDRTTTLRHYRDAVAEAAALHLRDPERVRTLRAAAMGARYDWQRSAARYQELYRSIVREA